MTAPQRDQNVRRRPDPVDPITAAVDPSRIDDPHPIPETTEINSEIRATAETIATTQRDVDQLNRQIREGEDVDHDAVPTRVRIRDHAMQVLTGLINRRARIHAEARLARLHALRTEIEGTDWITDADDANELLELVDTATTALVELHTAVNSRNQQIQDWRRRIQAEGVPAYTGFHPEPPPAHAGLAPELRDGNRSLAVGDLRIPSWIPGDRLLRLVSERAHNLAESGTIGQAVPAPNFPRPRRVTLATLLPESTVFYQQAPGNSPDLPLRRYRRDQLPHPHTLRGLVEVDRDTILSWAHRVPDRHQQAAADTWAAEHSNGDDDQ